MGFLTVINSLTSCGFEDLVWGLSEVSTNSLWRDLALFSSLFCCDVLNALYPRLSFFCRDLKANTDLSVCHRPVSPGRRKKARPPSHLRSPLELRTLIQAISTKSRLSLFLESLWSLNGGKNCHEAFVQERQVQVRRHPRPQSLCRQTFESQNQPIWVPTLLILNVSERGETGTCLTLLTVLLSTRDFTGT